jgi:rhodanese-related sulfurtransferase
MRKLAGFIYVSGFFFCNGIFAQDGSLPAIDFEKRINLQHPQLLDVRTAGEYQSGHLKNSLQADWLNKAQFEDRIKYLDKTRPLLVYCASGGRSAQAAKWLLENGFTDVQNLKGGLTTWKLEGKAVEGAEKKSQLGIAKYNSLSASGNIVLIDFGAEWCPPCKKMEPVLAQLQEELKGQFTLIKIDGGIDIDIMKVMKVDAIPTFVIYKKGIETWRKQGVMEIAELKKQLTE